VYTYILNIHIEQVAE